VFLRARGDVRYAAQIRTMADYNSMKVPELKKLLNERGLTQAGNKADLIARLHDNDKQQATSTGPAAGKIK
jgi:SAP domain-containing ribonucleoprotein